MIMGKTWARGLVVAAVLARPYGPFYHRVDYFQVGGIERQGQMYDAARSLDVRRIAQVVFDVARTGGFGIEALAVQPFEFIEQFPGAACR